MELREAIEDAQEAGDTAELEVVHKSLLVRCEAAVAEVARAWAPADSQKRSRARCGTSGDYEAEVHPSSTGRVGGCASKNLAREWTLAAGAASLFYSH